MFRVSGFYSFYLLFLSLSRTLSDGVAGMLDCVRYGMCIYTENGLLCRKPSYFSVLKRESLLINPTSGCA